MKTQMKDIKNLEEILVKAVPEIFVYFIVAFLIGNLLEALMPDVKSQGKLALSFEVFTQIFVYISRKEINKAMRNVHPSFLTQMNETIRDIKLQNY